MMSCGLEFCREKSVVDNLKIGIEEISDIATSDKEDLLYDFALRVQILDQESLDKNFLENPYFLRDGKVCINVAGGNNLGKPVVPFNYENPFESFLELSGDVVFFTQEDVDLLNSWYKKGLDVKSEILGFRKVSNIFVESLVFVGDGFLLKGLKIGSVEIQKLGSLGRIKNIYCIVEGVRYILRSCNNGDYFFSDENGIDYSIVEGKLQKIEYEGLSEEHKNYQVDILKIARSFSNSPYDTDLNGVDGGALNDWKASKDGVFFAKNYLIGDGVERDEEPMVCTDLIVRSLSLVFGKLLRELDSKTYGGDVSNLNSKSFRVLRRVNNVEKILEKNRNFDFKKLNFVFDGNVRNIPFDFMVGDIIATKKSGTRHIGIVTEVDNYGKPLKIIHSFYAGVTETEFFTNDILEISSGENRNKGFIGKGSSIVSVFRPNQKLLEQKYK